MTAGIMHSPTVRRIVGPTILLASGSYFDFLAPEQSEFTIEDIAHGLSNVCRFAGQCSRFYSVAQHSVLVSRIVPPEDAYAALMHDAAEALIGDVSKPLKDILPDYRRIEGAVEAAVFARFSVPTSMPSSVKTADMVMLATEQHILMPDREGRSYAGGHAPLNIDIPPMSPAAAKAAFLARYAELTGDSAPTPDLGAQGEPVAWAWEYKQIIGGEERWFTTVSDYEPTPQSWRRNIRPLYEAPAAPRKGPSEEETRNVLGRLWCKAEGLDPDELICDGGYTVLDATLSVNHDRKASEAIDAALALLTPADRGETQAVGDGWQPISTAPKDGSWILITGGDVDADDNNYYEGGGPSVSAFWDDEYSVWYYAFWDSDWRSSFKNPTHWRPLPKPPSPDQNRGEPDQNGEAR